MKQGSIALVNQVTTISKMRIFDPRNLKGVLAGISLSAESMEKINKKVKDYTFSKKSLIFKYIFIYCNHNITYNELKGKANFPKYRL